MSMSSKTRSAEKQKTKSGRRSKLFLSFGLVLACLVLLIIVLILRPDTKPRESVNNECEKLTGKSERFSCEVSLERAVTEEQRTMGLSGRSNLPNNQGMLFIFNNPARQCIWMKDMKFSLDIIWLNENKQIIKIMKNVPPSSFPNSFCADDTKYVIELNSGKTNSYGFAVGDSIHL